MDLWRMHAKMLVGKMSLLAEEQNLIYNFAPGALSISAITIQLCPRGSAFHPIHSTACIPKRCVDFDATIIFTPAILSLLSKLELLKLVTLVPLLKSCGPTLQLLHHQGGT